MVERKTLAERVSGLYYSHGVLCAAHPIPVIGVAVLVVLLACVPLSNLPLSSNVPQTYFEPHFSLSNSTGNETTDRPRWYSEPPIYVLQVIMKSAVSPWTKEMQLTDAIRGPMAEVFRLLEAIQNYQHPNGMVLDELCTHVEVPDRDSPLPQFNCLVVSPANFWRHDVTKFYMDSAIVSTVYREMNTQVGKATLAELLFGLSLKETGFKRYPLRNRQRVLQYAVTVVFRRLDKQYLDGLYDHLLSLYPTEEGSNGSVGADHSSHENELNMIHVYHLGDFDFQDFLPLFFTYLGLFFYMYFSVKKIEMVKSKVGMALSAVFTVIASLLMSIGLCLFFGLDPAGSSRGREVFPYLVVTVGLENILVLTKSVVSTPPHLDSKIRVAQGLSREGWSITKNLLTELTILTVGLFTLVPSIQEFCIFAMVGLLCDYFLQMCFFSTVLSLDMRSIEGGHDGGLIASRKKQISLVRSSLYRSRSSPRLDTSSIVNSSNGCAPKHDKVPKRLRLVLFWGSTRIVQRAFMLCMIVWIGGFLYSAGIVQHLVPPSSQGGMPGGPHYPNSHFLKKYKNLLGNLQGDISSSVVSDQDTTISNVTNHLKVSYSSRVLSKVADARPLQPVKWCYLIAVYNSSAASPCRLAVLPPLRLRAIVSPQRAISLRNPEESAVGVFKWDSLALALDPTESEYYFDPATTVSQTWETPYLPSTPLEVLLVMALSVISLLVACYTAMVLYRCVCSRNYAQWRSAWADRRSGNNVANSLSYNRQALLESMPCELKGASGQMISQIVSDRVSSIVCCSYLSGEIDVWCYASGQKLSCIDRIKYFTSNNKKDMKLQLEDDTVSDYESGSPPPLYDGSERYDHESPSMSEYSQKNLINQNRRNSRIPFIGVGNLMTKYTSCSSLCSEPDLDESDSDREELPLNCCPRIWCIDAINNIIVIGTSSGRLEFWEATTGQLKYIYEGHSNVGVTCVKLTQSRVIVARLDGVLDLLTIQWLFVPFAAQSPISSVDGAMGANLSCNTALPPRPAGVGHWRTASAGSVDEMNRRLRTGEATGQDYSSTQQMSVTRVSTVRAHQQTIMVVASYSDRVVTGSTDHTLRVFSLVDESLVFTLHGHCGPVTTLFIDDENPLTAGSGAQDGSVCLWDLLTGACVYCLQAHDGSVTAITYSSSYVLSLGTDERLCVWDRFHGHLLNTIQMEHCQCNSMVMLTHNLLITSKQGSLIMWDVRSGDPVRLVKLGQYDSHTFINTILPLRDHGQVICDYGNSLVIVRFPFVRDKTD